MELAGATPFLILEHSPDGRGFSLHIIRKRKAVVQGWNSSTRMSPLFCIRGGGRRGKEAKSPHTFDFQRTNYVFFIGPVSLSSVRTHLDETISIWATLGLRNVLITTRYKQSAKTIRDWLERSGTSFEEWLVKDGKVQNMPPAQVVGLEKKDRQLLTRLSETIFPVEMNEAIHEFCPLMASILTRAKDLPPRLRSDLSLLLQLTEASLGRQNQRSYMTDAAYADYRTFKGLNAGLSRFAAQTFPALPRIVDSECHYWSHSLLGLGTATLALWKIQAFLREQIIKSRFHERFEAYCARSNTEDMLAPLSDQDKDPVDLLRDISLTPQPVSAHRPLVTYFSSRDGFLNKGQTISAPLASVAAGNCSHWSLMTLTHEFSHILIAGVMSILFPRDEHLSEVDALLKRMKTPGSVGTTKLDEIRRSFIYAMETLKSPDEAADIVLAPGEEKDHDESLNAVQVLHLFDHWSRFIEEILVHAFDFAYFYGLDHERYVRGIWSSWRAIPNLQPDRIFDYVIRTVSAVMLMHLHKGDCSEQARRAVLEVFSKMKSSEPGTEYIDQAIDILKTQWETRIKRILMASKCLVRFSGLILFSQTLANTLHEDCYVVTTKGGRRQGYGFPVADLDAKIENPLRFLRSFSADAKACHRTSAWLYLVLGSNYSVT